MDTKTKKKLVKYIFTAVTSLAIGQLIKLERKMEERIDKQVDDYFDNPEEFNPKF